MLKQYITGVIFLPPPPLYLQVDKLEQSEAVRSEEEQKAEEKPLVFSEYACGESKAIGPDLVLNLF